MRPGRNCWRMTSAEAKRSAVAQNLRSLPANTPGDSAGLSPTTPRRSNTSRTSRRIARTVQGATVTCSFASSVGAMRGWDAMGCPTEEGSQAISVVTRSFATVKLGSDSFSAARRTSASATNGYTAAPGVARARRATSLGDCGRLKRFLSPEKQCPGEQRSMQNNHETIFFDSSRKPKYRCFLPVIIVTSAFSQHFFTQRARFISFTCVLHRLWRGRRLCVLWLASLRCCL